jgi:transposase
LPEYGVHPNQLFHWRKLWQQGALSAVKAGEEVVPASEARALRAQVRELQRLLGKKTMEVEILKDAIEIAREKKLISRGRYCRRTISSESSDRSDERITLGSL